MDIQDADYVSRVPLESPVGVHVKQGDAKNHQDADLKPRECNHAVD